MKEGRNYLVGSNDDRQHEILSLKKIIAQVCLLCFCVVLEKCVLRIEMLNRCY